MATKRLLKSRSGIINIPSGTDLQIDDKSMSPYNGYNYIINGGMRISQRGDFTSFTDIVGNTYHLDRWKDSLQGFTPQFKQQVSSLGSKSIIIQNNTGSTQTGRIRKYQLIEDFSTIGGNTVTVSADVKSNNANARLSLLADSSFVSSSVHSGNGTFEKLSLTYTLPALSSNLGAYFQISDSSGGSVSIANGDYIEFTNVKLEIGSVATPFVPRLYGEELALCQRYFQTINDQGDSDGFYFLPIGQVSATTLVRMSFPLPKELRVKPTSTSFYTSGDIGCLNAIGNGQTVTSIAVFGVSSSRTTVFAQLTVSGGGLVAGNASQTYSNTNNWYIHLDAEL